MTRKLLIRQGGGSATEVDFLNIATVRKGTPFFESDQPVIQMGQRFANGESAQGYCKVNDPEAEFSSTGFRMRPWAEARLTEDASGDELTLAWMRVTAHDASRRTPTGIGGDEVEHDPQFMDCNLDLRGIPFRNAWERDEETDQDRLNVLEGIKLDGAASSGTISRDTTDITIAAIASGHLADFSAPVTLDAYTYPDGTEVTDVISDIAEQSGKQWGVVLHHDGGSTHKCLLYIEQDDLTTYTTDVKISDDLDDLDPDHPTAPVFEPHWLMGAGRESNMEGVVSGLVGIYTDADEISRTVYVETGEAPEEWEVWVDTYNDDSANNSTQAERHTTWQLQDRRRPYNTHKVSILVSAEQAHLVEAGMAIETRSVVMEPGPNKHTWLWRRIAEKTIEPVADGRYWLHLHLERPHHAHGPAGGRGTPSGPSGPTPPEPGTVTTATGGGVGDNNEDQGVTVPSGTGQLIGVLVASSDTTPVGTVTYNSVSGDSSPQSMTVIGSITHPTPGSGGNHDGERLYVVRLLNPDVSAGGANIEWGGTAAGFGSLKGYWTTPSTETPTVITASGTGSTASVTPTGAGAEDMVLMCAGWRIWSLGNASQTPIDGSSQDDDWAVAFNNSAGQNDGCWYGGHLAGSGTRSVNMVTSTNWVAAAIILGGTAGTPGDETEPTTGTGGGSVGSGGTFSPINHVHEHGLLSDDELHYHDTSQIEGLPDNHNVESLPTAETDDTLVLAPDGVGGVEWVAGGGGGALDDLTDVNAPTPADGEVLTWDDGTSEWVSAAPTGGGDGGGRAWDEVARKTADETVTNSTTLQDDDALFFALVANEVWEFELNLWFSADAARDIKIAFTHPSGATMYWSHGGFQTGADAAAGSTFTTTGSGTTSSLSTNGAGVHRFAKITGTIVNGANAGNLQFQWAQLVATGDTVVYANSILRGARVAVGGGGSVFTDTVVYKSADESVSNTTLQNDDHLLFAVGANQEWVVEYNLFVSNAANTGDFKFDLSLPASAVGTQAIRGTGGGTTSTEGQFRAQAFASGTSLAAGVVASGTISLNPIRLYAYIDTAGTAGNVTLQWAQATTDGSNATVVKKGSWLRARRVV